MRLPSLARLGALLIVAAAGTGALAAPATRPAPARLDVRDAARRIQGVYVGSAKPNRIQLEIQAPQVAPGGREANALLQVTGSYDHDMVTLYDAALRVWQGGDAVLVGFVPSGDPSVGTRQGGGAEALCQGPLVESNGVLKATVEMTPPCSARFWNAKGLWVIEFGKEGLKIAREDGTGPLTFDRLR